LPSPIPSPADVAAHLLFFGSGATALVYEVLWMRRFTVLFGGTAPRRRSRCRRSSWASRAAARLFGRRADASRAAAARVRLARDRRGRSRALVRRL
jgi:hypothetical protein